MMIKLRFKFRRFSIKSEGRIANCRYYTSLHNAHFLQLAQSVHLQLNFHFVHVFAIRVSAINITKRFHEFGWGNDWIFICERIVGNFIANFSDRWLMRNRRKQAHCWRDKLHCNYSINESRLINDRNFLLNLIYETLIDYFFSFAFLRNEDE